MTRLNDLWVSPRFKSMPDLERCRASVHDTTMFGTYQCNRKASVFRCVEDQSIGFCRQHDPEQVAARRAARDKQWAAESAARNAAYDRDRREKQAVSACRVAMQKIADGHNDPRSLAIETLALFP